jgi:hypothetical protein
LNSPASSPGRDPGNPAPSSGGIAPGQAVAATCVLDCRRNRRACREKIAFASYRGARNRPHKHQACITSQPKSLTRIKTVRARRSEFNAWQECGSVSNLVRVCYAQLCVLRSVPAASGVKMGGLRRPMGPFPVFAYWQRSSALQSFSISPSAVRCYRGRDRVPDTPQGSGSTTRTRAGAFGFASDCVDAVRPRGCQRPLRPSFDREEPH